MATRTPSVLWGLLPALVLVLMPGCPPSRTGVPGAPGSCVAPAHTVAVSSLDTGMGVDVCVWVDNDSASTLWVSGYREWDIGLCSGEPVDLTRPASLEAAIEIPPGESRELLGWAECDRERATTTSGTGSWEPLLVFYVSSSPDDDACWNETRSPRLDGWYCEG
jgi:hypothetical protein